MNRVSDAPHIRSMDCRASPAEASAKSRSVVFANALFISCGVIAENRARSTFTFRLTARISSYASFPIQLPLGIKIGCNGDTLCVTGQFLEERDDPFLGWHLDGLCIDQAAGGVLFTAPVLVTGLEVDFDNVAA